VAAVDGFSDSAFAAVQEEFAHVLAGRAAGSALAVWHDGAIVVDLWRLLQNWAWRSCDLAESRSMIIGWRSILWRCAGMS
jgi:hypothetical protein